MQSLRERPGRHVGLTPDVPDRRGISAPFRPGRRLELTQTDVAGYVVVGPRVELTLADRGVQKPVTRDAVSPGRIVDSRDDPFLTVGFASGKREGSQRPTNQGAKQGATLHEYRSI